MTARAALNLILLAVLALLGWFALQFDASEPRQSGAALTALLAQDVRDIVIERNARTVSHLQRDGEAWFVRTPLAAAADSFRVQSLLGLLSARSQSGFRAAGNDLSQYGLEPPRASVRFNNTVLFIGDTDPVAGKRYVLSDDEVHLIEDNWFSTIFGDGTAWVDPSPLPANATPLRITIARGERVEHDWQRINGRWQDTPGQASREQTAGALKNPQPASGAAKTATGESARVGEHLAETWTKARALSVRDRDSDLDWNARVTIRIAEPTSDERELIFDVSQQADALLLFRRDLGVQYRFLKRQGHALLGDAIAP